MTGSGRVRQVKPPARPPFGHWFLAAAILGVFLALPSPGAISAQAVQGQPARTTTATPNATPPGSPTITSPTNGIFISSSVTTVSGTRAADQEIQLLDPAGGDPLCIIAVDGTTGWSCRPNLPNGPAVLLRVVVTGDSGLAAQISVAVLGAPTVTGGPIGQTASNGTVRGTAYPRASVTATVSSGARCSGTADDSGAWSCQLAGTLRSGTFTATATQVSSFSEPSSSNASAPVSILFDLDLPAAPVVSSPVAGAALPVAGATYSGSGETGATVTVFAGPYSVCTAVVSGAQWSCSAGGVAVGRYNLIAVQQDAAGNMGPGSTPIAVDYVAAAPGTPSPSATPGTPTAPAVPAAPADPSDPPVDPAPAPAVPAPTERPADPGEESAAAPPRTPGQWNDPTRFATAIDSDFAGTRFPWLQALLMGMGAVLLLALPSRLLAGTISQARGGRPLWRGTAIAGRNRIRHEFETAPVVRLNRWLIGAAALVAAATLVMLSGPVIDQPAYLRLLVAVIIALVIVNAAGSLVPLWWSHRVLRVAATGTFLPRYLVLVAITAIGSRVFDIHPALLFGLLGSVTVIAGPTAARRGQVAAVRAGTLIALAVIGWLVLTALPAPADFGSSLAAEVANTVVLGAIGSAVLVLIPIGNTSGRSILAWSPPVWAGLTVLAFTIMFAVLTPLVSHWQSSGTVTLLWIAAAAFAALSAGAWAWQRFVAPTQH